MVNIKKYEETKHKWRQIEEIMRRHRLERLSTFKSIYTESCFEAICQLMQNEYEVSCLLCIIAHNFFNSIMHNDSFEFKYIEKYMNENEISIIFWNIIIFLTRKSICFVLKHARSQSKCKDFYIKN